MRLLAGAGLVLLLLLGGAATALAGDLQVAVKAATVDDARRHLVLDVELHNTGEAELVVLLSEILVFAPFAAEAGCPEGSPVLGGPPNLQLGSDEAADPACALEARAPGPQWRHGLMRLAPEGTASLLITVQSPQAWTEPSLVRFSASYALIDELPRRLVRRAWLPGQGLYLSARVVVGAPGGGARAVRLFPHTASSTRVELRGRPDGDSP
jgi:hypothetical protein